jgi:hypothetical protein
MTTPQVTATAPCRNVVLALLVLALAFVPAIPMVPFLAYQAWWAFSEPVYGSAIWGVTCLAFLVMPFVGSAVAGVWRFRRGAGASWSILVAAAVAFCASIAGSGLIPVMYLMMALSM